MIIELNNAESKIVFDSQFDSIWNLNVIPMRCETHNEGAGCKMDFMNQSASLDVCCQDFAKKVLMKCLDTIETRDKVLRQFPEKS